MRRWYSRMPQGGLARWFLGHDLQTTNTMTTAATAAAILMKTMEAIYPTAKDRARGDEDS